MAEVVGLKLFKRNLNLMTEKSESVIWQVIGGYIKKERVPLNTLYFKPKIMKKQINYFSIVYVNQDNLKR
jgi:hypothetical protein